MSLRITGSLTGIRRIANLPADGTDYTITFNFKLLTVHATYNAYLAYTQAAGGANAQVLRAAGSTALRVSDDYEGNTSSDIATISAAGASGTNWNFGALRASGAGAGGLRGYHKPIGSGSLVYQSVANSNGTDDPEAIILGRAPFAAGDFGVDDWFFDGLLQNIAVYNRALTDLELAAAATQAAPVTDVPGGLISYHDFPDSGDVAAAMAPTTGSGTWSYFTDAPSLSADEPVFGAPTGPLLTIDDTMPSVGAASSTTASDDEDDDMQTITISEPTAAQRTIYFDAISDAGSPQSGLTFSASDLRWSKGGAAEANKAGSVTEIGGGTYAYVPTVAEVDTLGLVQLRVNKSGTRARAYRAQVVAIDFHDATNAGLSNLQGPSAVLDLANGVEAGRTVRQALQAISAMLAGDTTGRGSANERYKAVGNPDQDRLSVTFDADGNRVISQTL